MTPLHPCTRCSRHVRRFETVCPFCGAGLSFVAVPLPRVPTQRLGRGALLAFATLVASGCTASHTVDDAGMDARIIGGPDAGYGGAGDVGHDALVGAFDAADDGGAGDVGHDALVGAFDAAYGGRPDGH